MPKAKVSKSDPIYLKKPRKSKVIARLSGDRTAERILKGFDRDTRIVGLTNGAFSLISLISELLKIIGSSKITLSTWSAGFYDIGAFKELQDSGFATDIRIIIDKSFKTRLHQYSVHLLDVFSAEKIRTTKSHSKFVLLENNEWKVVILSSMNLNENIRSENFDVQHDPEVFQMLNDFANKLFAVQEPGLVNDENDVAISMDKIFQTDNFKKEKIEKVEQDSINDADDAFNINFEFESDIDIDVNFDIDF